MDILKKIFAGVAWGIVALILIICNFVVSTIMTLLPMVAAVLIGWFLIMHWGMV